MRQIIGEIEWEKKAVVFFLGILILTVLGPFGSYRDLVFVERLIYWTVIMAGVGFFMHVMVKVTLNSRYLARIPEVLRIISGALLAAIPGTVVVFFVGAVMRPPMMDVSSFWLIWAQVSIIGSLIVVLEFYDWTGRGEEKQQPARTRFHDRLPPDVGSDIVSLSMRDHYVEVTTAVGKHLVLMRMSDALDELDGLSGARTHRSHWVNSAHLVSVGREDKKTVARLSDGRSIPVSATYLDEVQAIIAP
ncbi:LytTR family DNA-binding domain-containing protein [Arenibacterium sp. CAU 1754]